MKMTYKTLLSLLVAAGVASAASEVELDKQLKAKQDSLESKRGLTVDGNVMGVFVNSYMSSDQETDKTINRNPSAERSNFVTADLGLHFRPYESVRANMILRFEAGMQNYFASSAKSISVPWMNIEGNVGKNFYWVIGDFRQEYSPLTIFAPTGIDDILYEPLIFSRAKEMARTSAMLEGNKRNLQGVNLQFRNDFGGPLGELRVEGIFARLRRVQVLDVTGANGNLLPYGETDGAYMSSNMDKWMLSANIELLPLNKNIYAGFTGMYVFDDSTSFTYTSRSEIKYYTGEDGVMYDTDGSIIKKGNGSMSTTEADYRTEYINRFELDPQRTTIISGRLGADVAGIMENKDLTLDVMAEVAMSNDKLYEYSMISVDDGSGQMVPVPEPEMNADGSFKVDATNSPVFKKVEKDDDGMAILATLNAGYRLPMGLSVNLSANYIMNDSNWYNNLAQSPQFFATRTLNSDKDGATVKYGVNSPLYSTFTSLYYFDPKFSPSIASNGSLISTTDDPILVGQTSSYNIAPYSKNSWGQSVYTRKELALMSMMLDPSVQMSLPNGLATANRNGIQANLVLGYGDFVEATGIFSMLNQDKSNSAFLKEAQYMDFGGGLKIDVFKMLGFSLPLEISGSYRHSTKTQEVLDAYKTAFADKGELNMDFINAGLRVQYLPRLGLNAGLQMINTEFDDVSSSPAVNVSPGYQVPLLKGNQMQWMVGLDYTIADGVFLALNYGWITVENTYNTSAGKGFNVPDYAEISVEDEAGNASFVSEYKHKFSQAVVQAVMNVNF